MKTALLIIDVQNDYFPNGKMELNNSTDAASKIKDLINHFRNRSMPIIHVQHISTRPGSTFFMPGTSGAEFHGDVKPIAGEKIIVKNFPNSFRKTQLNDYLKENNISKLVITGMMTHMCVDATARAAADFGFQVIVAEDACATRDLKYGDTTIPADHVHKAFLAALKSYGQVMTSEQVIAHLGAEQAKAI